MIQVKNLAKAYSTNNENVQIFSDLSWQIQEHDFVALMGSSGAGKSTLLSLLAGIMLPDGGSIEIGGREITEMSDDERSEFRGKNISFIFQAFELIANLTVEENIDLVLDISHAKRRYTTHDILARV
jgi:ABC-type lipoprotein export system ATPase subunit